MRWPRTLSLYVAREVVLYTLLGLAAITIVMATRNLMDVLEKLIGAGLEAGDLLTILRLIGTMLTVYALPVSFLFGVLLAIGRMAADVEITAMRACGVGIRGLLLPIGLLGLGLSVLTLQLTLYVEPAAQRDMSLAVRRLVVRGAAVEAGRFSSVGDRTLYVDERSEDGRLRGVVIADRSDPERPFLVFAESGRMQLDEATAEWVLRLERGDVHLEPSERSPERYRRLAFEHLEYRIDMRHAIDPLLRPRALPLDELRAKVAALDAGRDPGPLRQPPAEYRTHLQQRYAMPAAPALFALVGVPLGMRRKRGARSYGAIVCAVLAFGYYALASFCELLANESGFPPGVVWLPNLAFLALGLGLLAHARRAS